MMFSQLSVILGLILFSTAVSKSKLSFSEIHNLARQCMLKLCFLLFRVFTQQNYHGVKFRSSKWNLLSLYTGANTRESLTLKVFDSNFRMKDNQLMTLLKRADLESHGYKKEITTEMVKEPGIAKPLYRKTHFYFKIVHCSRLQEITHELQTLLPGKDLPCPLAD